MKLHQKIFLGFSGVLVLLLMIVLINLQQLMQVREDAKWHNFSEQIVREAAQLQGSVAIMQSDFRGYIITSNNEVRNSYYQGKEVTDSLIRHLKSQLSGVNPVQLKRLDSIQMQVRSWTNEIAEPMIWAIDNLNQSAEAKITYKRLIDTIANRLANFKYNQSLRGKLARFYQEEERYQKARETKLGDALTSTRNTTIVLGFSAFLVGLLLSYLLAENIRKRLKGLVGFAHQIAEGNFRERMKEEGEDELSTLTVAVNEMADKLEENFDRLERNNAELESFAWASSHDLKEPLRMISIYSELLSRKYESLFDETGKEYLSEVIDGVTRMNELINGLLRFSRVGKEDVSFSVIDSGTLMKELLHSLKALIEERKAVIEIGEMPQQFRGAGSLMLQVFQNLVHNAIKFTNAQPHIRISGKEEGNHFLFSVEDNGIGIDYQYHDKVFTMFQRLNGKSYEGSGIGLATCKKIIELHGGKIWFNSRPAEGTTFYFTLAKNPEK